MAGSVSFHPKKLMAIVVFSRAENLIIFRLCMLDFILKLKASLKKKGLLEIRTPSIINVVDIVPRVWVPFHIVGLPLVSYFDHT